MLDKWTQITKTDKTSYWGRMTQLGLATYSDGILRLGSRVHEFSESDQTFRALDAQIKKWGAFRRKRSEQKLSVLCRQLYLELCEDLDLVEFLGHAYDALTEGKIFNYLPDADIVEWRKVNLAKAQARGFVTEESSIENVVLTNLGLYAIASFGACCF